MAGERTEKVMREYRKLYRRATRAERGKLLDEFCRVTRYHRKYAITLLKQALLQEVTRNKRGKSYSHQTIQVLTHIWVAAGYPWSVRLKKLVPLWLPYARKHFHWITPEIEAQVLRISPRQIDRYLQEKKKTIRRRMYGRTKPGSLLKHHIPIKTDNWDVHEPGFVEIDLVSHSGPSSTGNFFYSLNLTDIHTGWCETRAIWGKDEQTTAAALHTIRQELPFPLKAIDSDNGSEFINYHLFRYCQKEHIRFTRGRPYKKDDNAHIEQKNWTHVRRIFGWARYDEFPQGAIMNDLYLHELRLMMNLFQPCVKLLRKERRGAILHREYDVPQTPLDRLVACYDTRNLPESVRALLAHRITIDPFVLSETIDKKLAKLAAFSRPRKIFEPVSSTPKRRHIHVKAR